MKKVLEDIIIYLLLVFHYIPGQGRQDINSGNPVKENLQGEQV